MQQCGSTWAVIGARGHRLQIGPHFRQPSVTSPNPATGPPPYSSRATWGSQPWAAGERPHCPGVGQDGRVHSRCASQLKWVRWVLPDNAVRVIKLPF